MAIAVAATEKMEKNNNNTNVLVVIAILAFFVGGISLLNKKENRPAFSDQNSGKKSGPSGLVVGEIAPLFSIRDKSGVEYNNENLKGKNVVLFFNEGLMCYPACWNQIVSLAQDPRFAGLNTTVLSIVTDRNEAWRSAVEKMPELGAALTVFDVDSTVSRSYGMLTRPSSMHYGQLPGHSYVIIDKEGAVRYIYDDPSMSNNNDKLITEIQKLK